MPFFSLQKAIYCPDGRLSACWPGFTCSYGSHLSILLVENPGKPNDGAEMCSLLHIEMKEFNIYRCAILLPVLCTESRTQFFGWVSNCGMVHCWRGCRFDLKTEALLINPCCEEPLLPSLLLAANLNTVCSILWFPSFHLLATLVLHKCQPFRRPFSFNEY